MKNKEEIVVNVVDGVAFDAATLPHVHKIRDGVVCSTDVRGYSEAHEGTPTEILVDSDNGFIPLWDSGVTLRWRFDNRALAILRDSDLIADRVRTLFSEAVEQWGDACPVSFEENADLWDFQITVSDQKKCSRSGCTLASAFFPGPWREKLIVYPTLFEQSYEEQVETFVHELGHIFGLRHFFAKIREERWASEIFGTHSKFSIMNYGEDSVLTRADQDDLIALYRGAWARRLTEINGTPVRLFRPYHEK